MTELELIDLFVSASPRDGEGVVVGIGDDAAVLRPPRGEDLVATVDAVVSGVHFDERFPPGDVGWKALAVNLSDLAAMGARPLWALCALATPREAHAARLAGLGRGLAACARAHRIALVGGNVTRASELSLTITAVGSVPRGRALTRTGARPGDLVLVSGTLGDAAAGLGLSRRGKYRTGKTVRPEPVEGRIDQVWKSTVRGSTSSPRTVGEMGSPLALSLSKGDVSALVSRQRRPVPRLALGRALVGVASAGLDVSDGLLQDLAHLCDASGVSATIRLGSLPLSPAYRRLTEGQARPFDLALAGGEDYELAVTISPRRLARAQAASRRAGVQLTVVGEIGPGRGVRVVDASGKRYRPELRGHDHLR